MKHDICKMLGIKYPIFQGAMTSVTDVNLVAAVSNAGGLGIFAPGDDSTSGDAAWLREQIRSIKALTDKPFGVNLAMRSKRIAEFVQVVCDEKVNLVTTGAGDPSAYIPQLKAAGVMVAPVVPDAKVALKMQAAGADMVVASGMEAGGFVGTVSTIVTVPQVTSAVNIPVIAAGGIADGKGFAAAVAMGASGVQMGTRFMLCKECTLHDAFKDAMLAAVSKDALPMDASFRKGPHLRCLKTKAAVEIQAYESGSDANAETYQQKFNSARVGKLFLEGNVDETLLPVGQVTGAIHEVLSAEEIMKNIMAEYNEIAIAMSAID